MRLKDLLIEAPKSDMLWHFTSASHEETIRRNGLKPGVGVVGSRNKAVFLTNATNDVLELVGLEKPPIEGMIGVQIDISEIKSKLKLDTDFDQQDREFAWYYEGPIGANDIIDIVPVTFKQTRLGYVSKV